MLASGDYPDMIFSDWRDSASKMVADGVAIRLNDYIDKLAPNIKRAFEKYPTAKKVLTLGNGDIAVMPRIVDNEKFLFYDGFFIRNDWLKELNLPMPETINDWYVTLTAFKNKLAEEGKADSAPFSTFAWMFKSTFNMAYGVKQDYMLNPADGKMTHGILEPNFKEYLTEMAKWYKEGLIDPNLLNVTGKDLDAMMLNDRLGSIACDNNNSIPKYQTLKPDLDIVPVPLPKGADGKSYYSQEAVVMPTRADGIIITTACKNVPAAVRVMDYMFTGEGGDLFNWGIEGESYAKDADGTKRFTGKILNNPDGKVPHEAICEYMTNTFFIGIVQYDAAAGLEEGLSEKAKFTRAQSIDYGVAADRSILLPLLPFTLEEQERIKAIQSDLATLLEENINKFILGLKPVSEYDRFVDDAKRLNIEEGVKIYQTAYDRYKSR
jgi:putative aldouronate transport system substrate-binding protein